jgi:predicted nucleotidyltransferase
MQIKKMPEKFIKMLPDKKIIILGLQGSRSLGLNKTNDADYDYRGVFVETDENLLGLRSKKETIEIGDSKDDNMDLVLHEVRKFFDLCLKGNPSVLSLLFLPEYNIRENYGNMIIENREIFLGEKPIRKAYGGYALSQILYLKRNHKFGKGKNTEDKIKKHLRHCFRLFDQGQELLETGDISFPLKDPDKYIKISEMNETEVTKLFAERNEEFMNCKSILPEYSNEDLVNLLLLKIRRVYR